MNIPFIHCNQKRCLWYDQLSLEHCRAPNLELKQAANCPYLELTAILERIKKGEQACSDSSGDGEKSGVA